MAGFGFVVEAGSVKKIWFAESKLEQIMWMFGMQ